MYTLDVQKTVRLLFPFANTSLEKFTSHWNYQSAILLDYPATKLWLAAYNTLKANLTIVRRTNLGPRLNVTSPKSGKEAFPSGILNTQIRKLTTTTGILNKRKPGTPNSASNQRTTALGNF